MRSCKHPLGLAGLRFGDPTGKETLQLLTTPLVCAVATVTEAFHIGSKPAQQSQSRGSNKSPQVQLKSALIIPSNGRFARPSIPGANNPAHPPWYVSKSEPTLRTGEPRGPIPDHVLDECVLILRRSPEHR